MACGAIATLAYSSKRASLFLQQMTGTPGNVSLGFPEDLQPQTRSPFCRDRGMACSHPNAPRLGKLSGTLWPGFVTRTFLHSRTDPSKSRQSFRL